jgi:hypothetical protein
MADKQLKPKTIDRANERGRLPCTKCRAPMMLARIEPAKPGYDLRTFECSQCNNVDQYIIEFGVDAPWVLMTRDTSFS